MRNGQLLTLWCVAFALVLVQGCSDDAVEGASEPACAADQVFNPVNGQCVARPATSTDAGLGEVPDTAGEQADADGLPDGNGLDPQDADAGTPDATTPDVGPDTDAGPADDGCDQDRDGVRALSCGGEDCNDQNPTIAPGRLEVCDGLDNSCDGAIDEGLDCTFYGHTATALYKINPFAMRADHIADLADPSGTSLPIYDIDTHPSGTLYGIAGQELYAFNPAQNHWIRVAGLGSVGSVNGLAIDNDGMAYLTGGNVLYRADLASVEQTLQTHGFNPARFSSLTLSPTRNILSPIIYQSSGDCVVNKQNTLYMTSNHSLGQDSLVEIDRTTGQSRLIGAIGYSSVYGLTAGWNVLFGASATGQLIAIDRATGRGTLLHSFGDKVWYGTASTPQR